MDLLSRRLRRGTGLVLVVLMLSACGGDAVMEPQNQAVSSCKQMAMAQYDLQDAGDDVEVSELTVEEGEGFTVLGAADDINWTCTWTITQREAGTKTTTTIDRR